MNGITILKSTRKCNNGKKKRKGGSGGQDRDVLFRLGVTSHPGTKKAIDDLQKRIKGVDQSIADSARKAAKRQTESDHLGTKSRRVRQTTASDAGSKPTITAHLGQSTQPDETEIFFEY